MLDQYIHSFSKYYSGKGSGVETFLSWELSHTVSRECLLCIYTTQQQGCHVELFHCQPFPLFCSVSNRLNVPVFLPPFPLPPGPLTEEKINDLEEMRNSLGLTKEASDRVLKAAKTEVYGTSAAAEDGKWTVKRIVEMAASGADVSQVVEETTRRNLYRKELMLRVADGESATGKLDPGI